jgi:2-amino-4-hydroxy-6-hydroxymethyldihydropteridine diphosphokinase
VDPSVGDVFSLDYSVLSSFIVQNIDIMNDIAELDSLAKLVQAKFNLKELTIELNAKLIHGNLISTVVLENEHLTIHNSLKNIHVFCIIGIHAYERIQKQKIVIDCKIQGKADFRMIGRRIYNLAEASSFETVEALCQYLGENMLKIVPNIAVRVGKTSAVSLANLAGIEMEFSNSRSHSLPVICYIGVGCNVGNRLENISRAFKLICQQVDVLDTSLLYESDPMYLLDQPTFLNSVIKVRTSMPPEDLLKFLKNIEQQLHRDFDTVRNGPRTIDLDILYYGDLCVSSEILNIPHLRLCEREFVLRPLSE